MEAKKYCLVFPGGKGLVGGWFLLAKKLRALGVSTPAVSKVFPGVPTSEKVGNSFKEKVKGTYANATGSMQGGSFAWRGGLNNQSQSRLNRFLVTDNWDSLSNGSM